jgi:hypothetical protein
MMTDSGDTHHPDSAPAPSREIQRLGALVGRWRSEGYIVGEVPIPITGTDIYECPRAASSSSTTSTW